MRQDLSIRLVENDDDLLAIALLKQADDSEFTGTQISEEAALEKIIRIKDDGSDFWIAVYEQKPVGYAIGIVRGESYRSNGIYVAPNYRLRGIGSALKQAQIEFGRNLGCDKIWSNVADANKASIRLQERMGFKLTQIGAGYFVNLSLRD